MRMSSYPFEEILVWGHPGKLAKLAGGYWDTHSSRSGPAVDIVREMASDLGTRTMDLSSYPTTEGLFSALGKEVRTRLANGVSESVARACSEKAGGDMDVSVVLVNMAGEVLGMHGDTGKWRWKKRRK
jgi:cobalt-precorrin-5B (C1)-methyltransferase